MSEKRLTVILYGCDRNTWRGGPVDAAHLGRVRARRAEGALRGAERSVYDRVAAATAVRRGPGLRLHVFCARSPSCLAAHSPGRLHPHCPASGSRRCDSPADARPRFSRNDGSSEGVRSASADRVAVCSPGQRDYRRSVPGAGRSRQDGFPEHRGEASRDADRRLAADFIRPWSHPRCRRSRVPPLRSGVEGEDAARDRLCRRPRASRTQGVSQHA